MKMIVIGIRCMVRNDHRGTCVADCLFNELDQFHVRYGVELNVWEWAKDRFLEPQNLLRLTSVCMQFVKFRAIGPYFHVTGQEARSSLIQAPTALHVFFRCAMAVIVPSNCLPEGNIRGDRWRPAEQVLCLLYADVERSAKPLVVITPPQHPKQDLQYDRRQSK